MRRIWALLCVLAGCAHPAATATDLRDLGAGMALTQRFEGPDPSDRLVVIVAGATDRPGDLIEEGFIPELRLHNHDDILVSYWNGPNYATGQAVNALNGEVAATVEQRGYKHVVWIGISAGGLIAIDMARVHPQHVDGLILYAPFLGPQKFAEEIQASGGLRAWSPKGPTEDIELTWLWLRGYASDEPRPALHLMYGRDDDFAPALSLLAEVLPPNHVQVGEGGHGWDTLRALWATHLEDDPLGLTHP